MSTKTRIHSVDSAPRSDRGGAFPPEFTQSEKRRLFGAVLLTAALASVWINNNLDKDRTFQTPSGAQPELHLEGSAPDNSVDKCETIYVAPGDTAWEIARDHVGSTGEVRGVVDDIQKQISTQHPDGVMQPGDKVRIC